MLLAGGCASARGMTPAAVVPLGTPGPNTSLLGVCAKAPQAYTTVAIAISVAASRSGTPQIFFKAPSVDILLTD
jgi:hypothetical protein